MGPRYVISVTKNEVRNEVGCYQNHIASHFNLAAGLCQAAISQNFKIACIYLLGALPFEI